MTNVTRIKRLAFGVFLLTAGTFSTVQARFDPICPYYACVSCPADWYGSCYSGSSNCGQYECSGSYGQCVLEGTNDHYEVCVCPPCV